MSVFLKVAIKSPPWGRNKTQSKRTGRITADTLPMPILAQEKLRQAAIDVLHDPTPSLSCAHLRGQGCCSKCAAKSRAAIVHDVTLLSLFRKKNQLCFTSL
jgi:hypothetical protein